MCVLSASKMAFLTDYFSCVATEDYVATSFRPQKVSAGKAMARQWPVGDQLPTCREGYISDVCCELISSKYRDCTFLVDVVAPHHTQQLPIIFRACH